MTEKNDIMTGESPPDEAKGPGKWFKMIFSLPSSGRLGHTAEQNERILRSICRTNYSRVFTLSLIIAALELLIIVLFDIRYMGRSDNYGNALKRAYLFLHAGMLTASVLFILYFLFTKNRKRSGVSVFERPLPGLYVFVVIILLVLTTLVDLTVTGKMVVFIYGFIITSVILLARFPWNMVIFGIPMALFVICQVFLPITIESKVYSIINCSVVYIMCVFLSTVLYRNFYLHRLKNIMLSEANHKLNHLATHDTLTELPNRRFFEKEMIREMGMIKRNKHGAFLMLLDIDHFKNINDRYGHLAGDMVLKKTADIINMEIRSIDIAARWGGEEFVLFLPATDAEQGRRAGERLRESISTCDFHVENCTIAVTASIGGVAIESGSTVILEEIFRETDKMLYIAKNNGRNMVVISS